MATDYSKDELQLTADVLVVGGGPAAAWAAYAAASQGVKVIIADKGFLGTSGAAAASGNGIMAPSPENWEKVVSERYRVAKDLANVRWIERVVDEEGNDLGGYVNGRRDPSFLPNALLKGPVYARLDRATSEVKAVIEKSHFIAYLPFKKAGIDPYTERVPVTLVYEGTVRGTGGIRIVNDSCGTKVPGLYAAGDAASREFLAGLASGGGGPNAAWAISTGQWAGEGAAAFAKSLGAHVHERVARPAGQVGLRSESSTTATFDSEAIARGVQDEMFPLEKNHFRSEQGLLDSLAKLEKLWEQVQGNPKQDTVRDVEFSRRAAALTAVARWAYFSALHRTETRSEHIRVDYPETDPNQRYYQATGGLDKLWVRRDWIKDETNTPTVLTNQTTYSVSKS